MKNSTPASAKYVDFISNIKRNYLHGFRLFNIVLACCTCLFIVPFFFSFLQGDDYWILTCARGISFIDYIKEYFFSISPRSGAFLLYRLFAPMICCHTALRVFLLAVFLLLFLMVFLCFRTIEPSKPLNRKLFISLITFYLYINQLPDIATGFHWWAAVLTYQFPLIFLLFLLILIHRTGSLRPLSPAKLGMIALCCFLTVIIITSNELFEFQLIAVLIILFLFRRVFQLRGGILLSLLLLSAGLSAFLLQANLKGNINIYSDAGNLAYALNRGSTEFYAYLRTWLSPAWLSFVLMVFFYSGIKVQSKSMRQVLSFVTLIPVLLFIEFFILFYAVGSEYVPYRAINTFWFLFLFQSLVAAIMLRSMLENNLIKRMADSRKILLFLFFVFLYYSVPQFNAKIVSREILSGSLASYKLQMNQRIALMKKGKSGDNFTFKPVIDPPLSVSWLELYPDERMPFNKDVARFYHVGSVKVEY